MPSPTLFDDDSVVDDISEEEFIGVIQSIIHEDEILRLIRGIVLPVQKKPRKTRRSNTGKSGGTSQYPPKLWGY